MYYYPYPTPKYMYGGASLVASAGKWACNEGALLNYNPTAAVKSRR
jgi:hypothetical protein